MSDTGLETCPSSSKPPTRPRIPAKLPWTMRNRRSGRLVRAHRLSSKLRKRERDEREGIRISSRNKDVEAAREHLEGTQSQAQLPKSPFSFTTTVRVAFDAPDEQESDSNAVEEYTAEDGAAIFEDSPSALEGSPKCRSEEAIPNRRHSDLGKTWTEDEDKIVIDARGQGWTITRINEELLPQGSFWALRSRIAFLRPQSGAGNKAAKSSPSTGSCPGKGAFQQALSGELTTETQPNQPALRLWPAPRLWTPLEDEVLLNARGKDWKYSRIQSELFPQRTYRAVQSRWHKLLKRSRDAHGMFSPSANSPSNKEGPLNLPLEETSVDPSLGSRESYPWTRSEDHALTTAFNQGLPISRIHLKMFPHRNYSSVVGRLGILRYQPMKASDNPKPSPSCAPIPAAKGFPSFPATDAKAETTLYSPGRQRWTDEEDRNLVQARNQNWSYQRTGERLLPDRSVTTIARRLRTLRERRAKVGKNDKLCCSSYGAAVENDAVDDEEFLPLPKEGDLKKIKKEKLEEYDYMAQEGKDRKDCPGIVRGDKEEAGKGSASLAEGNYIVANNGDLGMLQEEAEDMDMVVDDEDIPHLVSKDEEEVRDHILEDAEEDSEDEAAWEYEVA